MMKSVRQELVAAGDWSRDPEIANLEIIWIIEDQICLAGSW